MNVNGTGPNGARGPEGSPRTWSADAPERVPSRTDVTPPDALRTDRVEISAQGRALAEAVPDDPVGLLPQLVVRMRGRLASGFYERPEVMAETAYRILESGDL